MSENKGTTLTISADDVKQYLELAEASEKSLEDIQDAFRHMLAETIEHPFRSALPEPLGVLLGYLETLPYVDCDLLPDNAREIVKGWLLHSAVMLTFVRSYYEVMSTQA